MNNALLPFVTALGLSSCVVVPPPHTVNYTERWDIYNAGYPVHAVVGRIPMPLEVTAEQLVHYEWLKKQEAERNRKLLKGLVEDVDGY